MATQTPAGRCRAGRLRLDRRHPRPGADRRRALQVLALERGGWRDTVPDFATTHRSRTSCATPCATSCSRSPTRETLTFRNIVDQTALPMRHLGSFLPGDRRRRRGRALERPDLALPADRLPDRAATTQQRYGKSVHPARHDDPGLGRHLRRARAATTTSSSICAASRGKAGNLEGQDPARRQSVRRAALRASIPLPPLKRSLRPDAVRQGGAGTSASSRFPPRRQHVAALHEPARRAAGPVHLLRLLRDGSAAATTPKSSPQTTRPAGAAAQDNFTLRTDANVTARQSRRERQARDRRHLRRRARHASSSSRPSW